MHINKDASPLVFRVVLFYHCIEFEKKVRDKEGRPPLAQVASDDDVYFI